MISNKPPPNLPKYNAKQILKLHQKLSQYILLPLHGYRYNAADFDVFVSTIRSAIPKVDRDVLFQSINHLAGVDISSSQIDELAWRLAGNVHNLRNNIVVPPWSRQIFPEWALVQIMSVERCRIEVTKDDKKIQKQAAKLQLFVLAGLPAGHTISKTWTYSFMHYFRHHLGFDWRDKAWSTRDQVRNNYPFMSPLELTRFRFLAYIDPEESEFGPGFKDIWCPPGCRSWNRKLLKKRNREGFSCPMNYKLSDIPCHKCEQGYAVCSAACHPKTFIVKFCTKCLQESYFEPDDKYNMCVECHNKQVRG